MEFSTDDFDNMDNDFWTKERAVPMSEAIKIKRTTLYFVSIIILIAGGGFFMLGGNNLETTNSVSDKGNGEFQKVVLGVKSYNYYPNTVTVKEGKPVRIYLDSSVSGCLRSFTIRDFGVAKYLKTPSDYVEFTPTKKGSFRFACSMGMGTGTLIVE